jgi:hypothetical protein
MIRLPAAVTMSRSRWSHRRDSPVSSIPRRTGRVARGVVGKRPGEDVACGQVSLEELPTEHPESTKRLQALPEAAEGIRTLDLLHGN